MLEPDYYELVGVKRDATLQEIRSCFRAKVLAEHPDKGGDPAKFQQINKAYSVLSDMEKRRRYDQTGRTAELSAEEQFAQSFGGGRLQARPKEADRQAVVNLQEKLSHTGTGGAHEDGFAEWLRQRDASEMIMTDQDFMKTALFNSAEMATKINHTTPVQHVIGTPKTDMFGEPLSGPVQVQVKPRVLKNAIDHDELLVRMLAVPVDDSMVFAELSKSGVCLGMTGVGRIEQIGSRIEDLQPDDAVIVLPKPTKFSPQRPIGTARTLLTCHEDDVLRIPSEILEELTPEQICLTPSIVCAYTLLEVFGAKLKPGDSVLLNAAHLSATGSALLQLCKLLRLKALCLVLLPGAPQNLVRGEYGSKPSWEDVDTQTVAPPEVRAQYDRISEWLTSMGADEVFPDAVSLLRWRDRNQRIRPKLGLDGLATRDSCEQLIHCLQTGDQDGQLVVYGSGAAQPIRIPPPLLAAWGGNIIGFNIATWVHSATGSQANVKKMMSVMENITKLVRANKFALDTLLYKVGKDSISDAFSRAADATASPQVVLIFPTLQEETSKASSPASAFAPPPRQQMSIETRVQEEQNNEQETTDREELKEEWIRILFTDESESAKQPEGSLPETLDTGNQKDPKVLFFWIGDDSVSEDAHLRDWASTVGEVRTTAISWAQHAAGGALAELDLTSPEVTDGSWYIRDSGSLENDDLDLLHDVEVLGRALVDSISSKLMDCGLNWRNVVLAGFGKGAGILLYAALLKLLPKPVAGIILFSPVVTFPSLLAEKLLSLRRGSAPPQTKTKVFTVWGSRNPSTPGSYRQLLAQALRKSPNVQVTPDTLPDGQSSLESGYLRVLPTLVQSCLPH